jgi:hypothetical protein
MANIFLVPQSLPQRCSRLVPLRHPAFLIGVAVVLAALVLYIATLGNGLQMEQLRGGDLIAHQYAQVELRLTNAPGYPIYTMLGWAWFQLGRLLLSSWLNPTAILSSFSTLWSVLALIALYVLLLDITDGNAVISGLATAFYAVTYFFWYYSVATEEYSTAVLQTVLMLFFAFRWEETRDTKYLLLLALLTGIALANLVTVLFILPALIVFLLWIKPSLIRRGKLIAQGFVLAALPLVSYTYVWIRGSTHPEWWGQGNWPNATAWFIDYMSTRQGRGEMTWALTGFPTEMFALVAKELTPLVFLVGFLGIALLGQRRAFLLYGSLAVYAIFAYIDRFGNWFQVVIPAYPMFVMGLAVVADRLWQRWPGWPRAVLALALAALIVNRFVMNLPAANQHDRPDHDALRPGQAILASQPPAGATVVGTFEEHISLDYLTRIWGERRDLHSVGARGQPDDLKGIDPPFFVTVAAAQNLLRDQLAPYCLSAWGYDLIVVRREPVTAAVASMQPLDRDVGGKLRLLGYEAQAYPDQLQLMLYWQTLARLADDYAVSVRPTRGGQLLFVGDKLVQRDHPHPVWGVYPTSRWQPGEVVVDAYVVTIPSGQSYDGAMVVMYRALPDGKFDNLGEVRIEGLR